MLDYPLKNSENKNKEKACGQAPCLVHCVSPLASLTGLLIK